jgi:exonuclease III
MSLTLNTKEILGNFGSTQSRDLLHILNLDTTHTTDDPDVNDLVNIKRSPYYDINGMTAFLEAHRDHLTVLSLNARSIFNKHHILSILSALHDKNLTFDIICIQECWLTANADVDPLNIKHYKLIHQGYNPECSTKGGLVCYINEELPSKVTLNCNKFKTWEGLFINVQLNNGTQLTIGNIYRPPKDTDKEEFNAFINEFLPIVEKFHKSAHNLILAGDFNVDLLQINKNKNYLKFYDIMTSHCLNPTITYPTRLPEKQTDINPSLIDQFYTKLSSALKYTEAGILHCPISDHLPTFLAIKLSHKNSTSKPKLVKVQINSTKAQAAFISELATVDWSQTFDHKLSANPLITYKSFTDKLESLHKKHLSTKMAEFN